MEEHVEARLAGVLAHDVGGRQVEQRGAQLSADRVQQHRLAAALHQSETRVGVTCRPADQSQLTSGPTISTDLIAGVFSRSSGEPSGRMQYYNIYKLNQINNILIINKKYFHLRDEPPDVGGARAWLHAARLELGAAVRDVADILLQAHLAGQYPGYCFTFVWISPWCMV